MGEPFHFGPVGLGFFGDEDFYGCIWGEDGGEAIEHAVGAAGDLVVEGGVGLVEPGGEADAAGDAVEFGDTEAVFAEEQVGADDPGQFIFEGVGALELDDVAWFSEFEPMGDPGGLLSGDAMSVEEVAGAVELVEDFSEVADGLGGGWIEGEGFGGGAPIELLEEAMRGELVPDGLGLLDGGHGGLGVRGHPASRHFAPLRRDEGGWG